MERESFMDGLRKQVRRTIGDNALVMTTPEKQWWNLPAKVAAGRQIAAEEETRAQQIAGPAQGHNDGIDAMRHARWSNRMATEIDPVFSRIAGAAHEFENMLPSAPTLKRLGFPAAIQEIADHRQWHDESDAEALMDKRNNAEGRLAAAQGRAIDPRRLQTGLDAPSPANPAYPQARPRGGGAGRR